MDVATDSLPRAAADGDRMSGQKPSDVTAWLAQHGLPLPYLPTALRDDLRAVGESLFCTRAVATLPASPYELPAFVEEAEDRATADYALIALDGHGVNSWALHYFVVCGRLAMFFQLPWGGAYTDKARAQQGMARLLSDFEPLIRAAEAQKASPGPRLLVVISGFTGTRVRLPSAPWQEGRPDPTKLLAALLST